MAYNIGQEGDFSPVPYTTARTVPYTAVQNKCSSQTGHQWYSRMPNWFDTQASYSQRVRRLPSKDVPASQPSGLYLIPASNVWH